MKRSVKTVLILVPVLVIVLLVAGYFLLNSMVRKAVVTVLPRITGTPATLDRVSLSPFSGKGTLEGLVIGNPEGFETDSAFSLGTVRVDVDVASLLSDTIVIEEIYINAPEVTYEQRLGGSNIGKIQENVEKFAGAKKEEPGKKEPKKAGKKVQILLFKLENGKIAASAQGLQGRKLSVPLPDVEMKDIGKESGGESVGDVARRVFSPLGDTIETAATQALAIKDMGKGTVDKVKDLFK